MARDTKHTTKPSPARGAGLLPPPVTPRSLDDDTVVRGVMISLIAEGRTEEGARTFLLAIGARHYLARRKAEHKRALKVDAPATTTDS